MSWLKSVGEALDGVAQPWRGLLKTAAITVGLLLMLFVVTVPFDLASQCYFGLACFAATLVIRRIPGRIPVMMLVVLSLVASLRYMYWRLTSTLDFDNWLDSRAGSCRAVRPGGGGARVCADCLAVATQAADHAGAAQ